MAGITDRRPGPLRVLSRVLLGALALGLPALVLGFCGYFDPLDDADDSPKVLVWQKTYGGSGRQEGMSVAQAKDGGYVCTGTNDSSGSLDLWLLKTDGSGNEQWSRTYGGSAEDRGLCVQQAPDGGFIVAGVTSSCGAGSEDVWLIKTDSAGNEEWSRTYGGTGSEHGNSVWCTADGGYVVVGGTDSFGSSPWDVYLVKTDGAGKELWGKAFGVTQGEGHSIRQTGDGGYVIGGTCAEDGMLLKTDSGGVKEWCRLFGNEFPEYGKCAVPTRDGGYALSGSTRSGLSGDFDAWLIKTDKAGIAVWSNSFGAAAYDRGECVRETADGGYVIAGTFRGRGDDMWLIRADTAGELLWSETFGGGGVEQGLSVELTADGGVVIVGSADSGAEGMDLYLVYYRR
jgi:hypothetical protein